MQKSLSVVLAILLVVFSYPTTIFDAVHAEEVQPKTEAADVFIVEVQTRTQDDTYDEFITIFNAGEEIVDITDWQLQYMTSDGLPQEDDSWSEKILSSEQDKIKILQPDEFYTIASNKFIDNNETEHVDLKLASGSRQDGAHIRLLKPGDDGFELVDYVAWGDVEQSLRGEPAPAAVGDETIARCFEDGVPRVADSTADEFFVQPGPLLRERFDCAGIDQEDEGPIVEDDADEESGEGNEDNAPDEKIGDSCADVVITEILPNPREQEIGAYVEVFNAGSEAAALGDCSLEIVSDGGTTRGPTPLFDIVLEPNAYYADGTEALFSTVGAKVYLLDSDQVELHGTVYPVMPEGASWARFGADDWAITYEPTPDRANAVQPKPGPQDGRPGSDTECSGIIISEVLPNPQGPRSEYPREDNAFVELHNPGRESIELYGCGLRAESASGSTTDTYWFEDEVVAGEQFQVFYEADTGVQLPVNPSATVFLLDWQEAETSTSVYPESMPEAASWSWFDDNIWVETFAPTPDERNQKMPLRPCPEGQQRNPDTNRCRANRSASQSSLTPCLDGQERNPATNRCRSTDNTRQLVPCESHQERNLETNRCRNVQSASRQLVPCESHQERNPETNRCRNIQSASRELVPCKEGQERNPETNRCRNVAAANSDTLGVQDVAVATAPDTGNWLMISFVAGLALLYGAWEWRHELKRFYARLRRPLAAP